jgi:glyoxylase-like metal-dependent hydrolase (beta-lactamase superfamily II)
MQRGDNFSYIIADDSTKEAAVVDPSFNADAIIRVVRDQNLNVKYVIDTHDHFDHTASNEDIKSNFGAKVVAHKLANVNKDVSVVDGDVIRVGNIVIKVIHTPGHTRDSVSLLVDDMLLTGDTLFVGECGRTDLPSGSAEDLYHSLFDKLMKLDDNIKVYPGHDYGPKPYSTIGVEKRTNYVLQKRTVEEFIAFMNG